MNKFSYKKIIFLSIFLILILSIPILATQIPNETQIKIQKLQKLKDEVESESITLEKSKKEVEKLIQKNGLTSETKSMIDKNYELNQKIKEKIFNINKLEIETDQVNYDEKMRISLSTFEVALKDNVRAVENAPDKLKGIITDSANKKQAIYYKYLKLFNEKSKTSKELYFGMDDELSKVNYEVEKSIEELN